MNYTEAMQFLSEAGKRGIVPGLDNIRNLLKYLNDPQDKLQFVHVAGTNGKGSTTAMIASVAAAAGYTAGRYTSPAVFCDREKYAVNGRWITEDEYAACMEEVAAAVRRMESDGLTLPTSFEVETALAMVHFLHSKCDLVVLETGMGGAMDATNAVSNTLVAVLTAIGMDHVKFLGATIEEIAAQKAGIIKPGCSVVLHRQSDAVTQTVRKACEANHASLRITAPETIDVLPCTGAGQRFRCAGYTIDLPLEGTFQQHNAAGAIEAVLALREKGFRIPDEAILSGLKNVNWPGRMQQICARPKVYIDGAHNPNAAARLAETIPLLWPDKRTVLIMGVLADKDFGEVAQMVCPFAQHVITVTPKNPRALDARSLADAVRPHCLQVQAADSAAEALKIAIGHAGEDGIVLAFGSLSYLNEIALAAKEL